MKHKTDNVNEMYKFDQNSKGDDYGNEEIMFL